MSAAPAKPVKARSAHRRAIALGRRIVVIAVARFEAEE